MVNHLTFEELLEFNSIGKDGANSDFARAVATHVRTCKACRLALSAIQSTEETVRGYSRREVHNAPTRVEEKRTLR